MMEPANAQGRYLLGFAGRWPRIRLALSALCGTLARALFALCIVVTSLSVHVPTNDGVCVTGILGSM